MVLTFFNLEYINWLISASATRNMAVGIDHEIERPINGLPVGLFKRNAWLGCMSFVPLSALALVTWSVLYSLFWFFWRSSAATALSGSQDKRSQKLKLKHKHMPFPWAEPRSCVLWFVPTPSMPCWSMSTNMLMFRAEVDRWLGCWCCDHCRMHKDAYAPQSLVNQS